MAGAYRTQALGGPCSSWPSQTLVVSLSQPQASILPCTAGSSSWPVKARCHFQSLPAWAALTTTITQRGRLRFSGVQSQVPRQQIHHISNHPLCVLILPSALPLGIQIILLVCVQNHNILLIAAPFWGSFLLSDTFVYVASSPHNQP